MASLSGLSSMDVTKSGVVTRRCASEPGTSFVRAPFFLHPRHSRVSPLVAHCSTRTDGAGSTVVAEAASSTDSRRQAPEEWRSPSVSGVCAEDSDEEVCTIMEGVTFTQLCDDFQCVSSPAVERTARQLARDIHDVKENRRSLSCFALNVSYKDPLRSFTGRNKYQRPSWIVNGLEQPTVTMVGMEMLSTSVLVIKWRLQGSFRLAPGANVMGATLDLLVSSKFTLNQISGQVTEHVDEWDLSQSSPQAAVLFFVTRLAWSTVEKGRDLKDLTAGLGSMLDKSTESGDGGKFVFRDPSGDPRKFFVQDDPNRDLYQFALGVALLYLLVQFLQQVL